MERLMEAAPEDLMGVHEVGERVAASIRQFFDRQENRSLVEELRDAGLAMTPPAPRPARAPGGPWDDQTVVITGTIPGYSRDEIKKMIRSGGGKVAESVSKKTHLVISGADPGSKAEKARALGIRVMETEEFLQVAAADAKEGR
jgi:DNA ligase (NAD+)